MAYNPTTWVEKATKVGPTNLNKLELGLQAAAAVADAALPVPAGGNGQFLKRVGGVWVPTSFAISDIPDPGAGNVVGSLGAGAVAVKPPGFEWNYTQRIAAVNVASTTEAAGTTIFSPGAITFDGAPVLVVVFAPYVVLPAAASQFLIVCLFEGATEIGRLAVYESGVASANDAPLRSEFRFTPSAGSHTYTITAFATSLTGTPAIGANPGGTGLEVPAFVRFIKV